jgi:transposase
VEYSEAFKRKMVQRMLGPGAKTATELSEEVRVHQSTLSRWLRQASTLRGMERDKPPAPPPATPSKARTAQDKLRIVLAAAACSPDELGALLRREGLHEADLASWREAMTAALDESKPEASAGKGAVQSKRIRQLERELHRKDKALAEAAALLVLQKKVRALWGDEGDDTPETNES